MDGSEDCSFLGLRISCFLCPLASPQGCCGGTLLPSRKHCRWIFIPYSAGIIVSICSKYNVFIVLITVEVYFIGLLTLLIGKNLIFRQERKSGICSKVSVYSYMQ